MATASIDSWSHCCASVLDASTPSELVHLLEKMRKLIDNEWSLAKKIEPKDLFSLCVTKKSAQAEVWTREVAEAFRELLLFLRDVRNTSAAKLGERGKALLGIAQAARAPDLAPHTSSSSEEEDSSSGDEVESSSEESEIRSRSFSRPVLPRVSQRASPSTASTTSSSAPSSSDEGDEARPVLPTRFRSEIVPGAQVYVTVAGKERKGVVLPDGKYRVELPGGRTGVVAVGLSHVRPFRAAQPSTISPSAPSVSSAAPHYSLGGGGGGGVGATTRSTSPRRASRVRILLERRAPSVSTASSSEDEAPNFPYEVNVAGKWRTARLLSGGTYEVQLPGGKVGRVSASSGIVRRRYR